MSGHRSQLSKVDVGDSQPPVPQSHEDPPTVSTRTTQQHHQHQLHDIQEDKVVRYEYSKNVLNAKKKQLTSKEKKVKVKARSIEKGIPYDAESVHTHDSKTTKTSVKTEQGSLMIDEVLCDDYPGVEPGSYFVHGPDHRSVSSSNMPLSVQSPPHGDDDDYSDDLQVVTQAQLVDETMEAQRMESERSRIRAETFQEIAHNAPKAEIVDVALEKKQRRRLVTGLVGTTILFCVLAVVLGVTLGIKNKNSDGQGTVKYYVQTEFGDQVALTDTDSPQYQSIDWMTNVDMYLTYPLQTHEELVAFRQRYVMCVVAFSTGLGGWRDAEGWGNPNTSDCIWHGINCDKNGRIIGINLALNNLNGTTPTELGALFDLRDLFLYDNPLLRGTLPTELGEIKPLKSLYAQGNGYEGRLPTELGRLAYLEKLNLSGNNITGGLPNEFTNMHSLMELDLGRNGLTGSIPATIWRLQRLQTLALNDNRMSGSVPLDLARLIELRRLDLSNNMFSGDVPAELDRLVHLEVLTV